MNDTPDQVFVERRTYRVRRLADAVRLLPILGAGLFCLPLLWALSDDKVIQTSHVMSFIFLTWVGLIAVSGLISSRLRSAPEEEDTSGHKG